mgnify:FL=1
MKDRSRFVIGLTGNIACGKSTVSGMLAELGARVLDADLIAHEALVPSTSTYQRVVQEFGSDILRTDLSVDRAALGRIVFADPDALRRLEQIVHPYVVERISHEVSGSPGVVVIDAIKLFESGLDSLCDEVWVVTCAPEQQLERLRARSGLTREEALRRINAQPPQGEKVRRADVVIDNSGGIEDTRRQVLAQWERIAERLAT